ncbi:hypothetical protein [Azospirillum sp. B510]|uniref:hypothetical protein n=1 Tax=Azospirillum sp. (strain B510) TaxID=137722 RepID=UPI00030060E4|nr:hypothetical protein [Azospirillum sp. B510]
MARYIVTKPFNTATRRFAVGQEVTDADLGDVLTLGDRVNLGQIAETEEPEDSHHTEPPATEEDAAGEEPDHFTA